MYEEAGDVVADGRLRGNARERFSAAARTWVQLPSLWECQGQHDHACFALGFALGLLLRCRQVGT